MLQILERESSFPFNKKYFIFLNPLSTNPAKWPNTLKQFVGNLPTSVLDFSVGLALKGLMVFKFIRKHLIGTIHRGGGQREQFTGEK